MVHCQLRMAPQQAPLDDHRMAQLWLGGPDSAIVSSGHPIHAVGVLAAQDPKKRATADAILQHSWMRENGTASDRPLDNVILTRMRGFAGMNKLKKEALKVIAAGMSPEEIAGLHALFQARGALGPGPGLRSERTCLPNCL